MFKDLCKSLCDLIYPRHCLICKKGLAAKMHTNILCPECLSAVEANRPPFCLKCSRFLKDNPLDSLCRECQRNEFSFDRAWAAALYNERMKELLHMFKYQNKTALKNYFAELMFAFLETYRIDLKAFHVLMPIPLHPTRLRERGYNQSQLLAEYVSRRYSLTPSYNNLIRTRHTPNQALLKKKERWTNIAGAFKIMNPSEVHQKSVLLVDDLLTTGATISEAARLLKEAGAQSVSALTLAIAY